MTNTKIPCLKAPLLKEFENASFLPSGWCHQMKSGIKLKAVAEELEPKAKACYSVPKGSMLHSQMDHHKKLMYSFRCWKNVDTWVKSFIQPAPGKVGWSRLIGRISTFQFQNASLWQWVPVEPFRALHSLYELEFNPVNTVSSPQGPRFRWQGTCCPTPQNVQWQSPGPQKPSSSVSNKSVWLCWR